MNPDSPPTAKAQPELRQLDHDINNNLGAINGYLELLAADQNLPEPVKRRLTAIRFATDEILRLCALRRASRTAPPPSPDLPAAPADLPSGTRILVIEDEPGVGEMVCELLEICGAQAELCLTAEAGLARLREEPFAGIVLDYGLPGLNGADFAARVTDEFSPRPAVIMATGRADLQGESTPPGVDALITKPFRGETLRQALLTGLQRTRHLTETEPRPSGPAAPLARLEILLAEDDLNMRHILVDALEKRGHRVAACADGHAARELIDGRAFDILVLDWQLPGLTGLELCRRARTTPLNAQSYVLMVTGRTEPADLREALAGGADDYLTKPFPFALLEVRLTVAEQTLQGRRRRVAAEEALRQANERLEERVRERTAELSRSHAALTQSEHNYRELVEKANSAIVRLRPDGTIAFWNEFAESLFGYSRAEIIGRSALGLVLPDSPSLRRQLADTFSRFAAGREEWAAVELSLKRRTGEPLWMVWALRPIRDPAGAVTELLCVGSDLTTIHNTQRQLVQAEKLASLGTLVSGVAHEINNPVHFIMLNLPLVKDALNDAWPALRRQAEADPGLTLRGLSVAEAERRLPQLCEHALEGARRIKNIVAELKNYAQPSWQEFKEGVSAKSVVEAALVLLSAFVRKHTNRFSFEAEPDLPALRANPNQLEQVVINLTQNACLALTDPDQEVRINLAADRKNDGVILTVEDEGRGIQPQNLSLLTTPFFTTRRSEGGMGLGLSICARIIRDHHGELLFESQPGKGTKAIVRLPIRANERA